jgi:serine phosphatase RsbU (regulator of sigma subunit)
LEVAAADHLRHRPARHRQRPRAGVRRRGRQLRLRRRRHDRAAGGVRRDGPRSQRRLAGDGRDRRLPHARRNGLDLPSTVTAVDAALAGQFGGEQFVTAVLAELDLASGRLRWHLAGHPAPLLLRGTQVVKTLNAEPGLPLGLGGATAGTPPVLGDESLEPGDRVLLFTDGVVEARSAEGELFSVDRLADLVGREAAAGRPAPETMRRLMHAILAHQAGALQDDATTMLVEWQGGGTDRINPNQA